MNNWKKNTALFLSSQAISLFGSSVVSFAIVWFVTRQTHSGLWVSLLTISSYLPQFVVSFFAGVWADRYSRKKLIIATDTMIAAFTCLLVLLIPRLTNTGIMMAALIVISFIRSVGAGVQTPAVAAMIPSLVPEDKLMKINGYNASIQSAVQFAAPAAAGIVLSFMPLSAVLMIDIVTAVIGVGIWISVNAADKVFCIFSVAWNRTANLRLRSWKRYCAEQNIVDFRSRSIKGPDFGVAIYSDGGYGHG